MTPDAFITTSWDDGHPLDLRLAELLLRYGLKGTFYVPTNCSEWPLITTSVRELLGMGMEIGSHTVSHAILPNATDSLVRYELTESKKTLEDLAARPITAFCFPKGRFNARTCLRVQEAGYRVARTTVAFHTERQFNPACMPVSVQFVPHSRQIHCRHALKERNGKGLLFWCHECGLETNLRKLCLRMLDRVATRGGVFHLWGHSWEVDRLGLWDELEEVLRVARSMRMTAVSNLELVSR
jgi:peptidoglycan/xylan/chitin deacetylase (PgdA/CDA1 family)